MQGNAVRGVVLVLRGILSPNEFSGFKTCNCQWVGLDHAGVEPQNQADPKWLRSGVCRLDPDRGSFDLPVLLLDIHVVHDSGPKRCLTFSC